MGRPLPPSTSNIANGYIATFVGGVAIAEQGQLTGANPGQLVRMGPA
jgi:N-acyl-D-aspartate/D-glutamate deacylase